MVRAIRPCARISGGSPGFGKDRRRRRPRAFVRFSAAAPGKARRSSASVAWSGRPQIAQPESPRNSTCFQQSAQKLWTSAMIVPQPAQRGGSAKSRTHRATARSTACNHVRSCRSGQRSAQAPRARLFDMNLRASGATAHTNRASSYSFSNGHSTIASSGSRSSRRRFDRAVLVGCPDPHGRAARCAFAHRSRCAAPADCSPAQRRYRHRGSWQPRAAYDLVLAVGTLDTVNDLPLALRLIRGSMATTRLFIGAMSGGDTLPKLRAAMRAAD